MPIPEILSLPPNRVWRTYLGGRTLDLLEGRPHPADSHFAEDWIASTTRATNSGRESHEHEGYSTVQVDGGTRFLKELIEEHPYEMVGREHFEKYGANTQFLLKFLDSAVRLHIQAHPTASFAETRLGSSSGKTEAYVILGVREEVSDPFIYLGFQHPPARKDLRRAVLEQDRDAILGAFERIPVRPGDVFFVPGGLPHAIGEGIFMIEIMEPTDFAVRLEFERGGYVLPEAARFMGRDVDFALDMMDFTPLPVPEVVERYFCRPRSRTLGEGVEESVLIGEEQTPCFSVRRLRVSRRYVRPSTGFHVGIVTRGEGRIRAGRRSIAVRTGDRFLVPFHTPEVDYAAEQDLEVVLVYPPAA